MEPEYEQIHRSDRMKLQQDTGYAENTFGESNLTGLTTIAQENNIGTLHWHDSIFS
jgi:hypothetical protein